MTRMCIAGLMALASFALAADDPPQERRVYIVNPPETPPPTEERDFFLDFLVVDGDTGRPVEAATVLVNYGFSRALP